jgi:hypothetical protein
MKNKKNHWQIKENVIKESKKYSSRTEFNKNSRRAYDSAKRNKWIDEMYWLDLPTNKKHPHGYWKNKKNIMKEARKYKTNDEFKKGNLTAFLAAYRYGYIDDMTWLIKRKQHKKGYWNYKHIEEEALKYTTKTEFAKKCNTAYRKALKMGIIDDFFLNNYIEF